MENKQAFTLIELLVVVLIIGILAAVAVPQYKKAVHKTQLTEALILGKHFQQMETVYKLANGNFTASFEELQIDIPKGYDFNAQYPYSLGHQRGSFQIENNSNRRIIFYYYPNGTNQGLALALFFSLDSGKIACHSFTQYGRELCGSLPL